MHQIKIIPVASACLIMILQGSASATEFFVSDANDIDTAMQSAVPGDTLIMTDGTWTNQQIDFAGVGTETNPITLRAETPGGVMLNGSSTLSISGNWLIVDGLYFNGGALSSGNVVEFRGGLGDATHCRFTNSAIVNYNPADIDTRYFWVSIYGESNRVDHNFFSGQTHSGVTVVVWRNNASPNFHLIDNNYFADRPAGTGNGFETIRIGTSTESLSSSFTTVESNLFERTDGEIEIISNKSGNNIFRYNTFREAAGTLTLRHGNNNLVEGNFFLGAGKNATGGVRVIGEGQTIINNYFHDLDGRADGAISISAGVANTPVNGYGQVKDALIAHNTIVDVNDAAIIFNQGMGSSSRTLLAEDVTIANNLIDTFQDPAFEGTQGTGWFWEGNIVNTNSLGVVSSSDPGIDEVDPQLMVDSIGIFRLSSSSAAVDAALGDYGVLDDFDGQPRIGLLDVGADEFSSAPVIRLPLQPEDVGPSWLNETDPPAGGGCGPDGCAVQAEGFTSVLDPDNDGNMFSVVENPDALADEALRAPGGDRVELPNEAHDTIATYVLEFETEGTYTLYYRARGFDSGSDSLFLPDEFNVDPDDNESIPSNGNFAWIKYSSTFTIDSSNVGVPVEIRFGMRENDAELDAFVLHLNSSLSDNQLDELFNTPDPITGDFDADGDVDGDDVDFYIGNLDQPATGDLAQLDLDGDGNVTISDHNLHVTTLVTTANGVTGALLGDVDVDGTVSVLSDGFALVSSLGQSVTSRAQGDLNADGVVSVLGDGFILISQLGQSN